MPDPEPGPDEVLIEVAASAVNRADLLQRQGHYPPPPGAPAVPRAGVLRRDQRSGRGDRLDVGEQVCALLAGGGYAERVAVPAGHCCRCRPASRWWTRRRCPRWPARSGRTWSQVARLAQGRDAAGARRRQRHRHVRHPARRRSAPACSPPPARPSTTALRELGAEVTIDYATRGLRRGVQRVTGGRGADVILDIMGASYLERNVEALATGGRLVVIGLQGGARPSWIWAR